MASSILIFSTPFDAHTAAVEWALHRVGVNVDVVFLSDFPKALTISLEYDGNHVTSRMAHDSGKVYDSKYDVVWRRRCSRSVVLDSDPIAEPDRKFARLMCQHTINELFQVGFREARWVNKHPAADLVANSKLVQLQAAAHCGFRIPKTLISNNKTTIADFIDEAPAIMKLFRQHLWFAGDKRFAVQTVRIEPTDLTDDDSVRFSPAIFQPFVDKAFELRVTWMGGQYIALRIDPRDEAARLDWRRSAKTGAVEVKRWELDDNTYQKLCSFMAELDLEFGCVDLIITADGEPVFLEVNEMGNFLWKEVMLPELPLLGSFISFLVGGDDRVTQHPDFNKITFANFMEEKDPLRFQQRSSKVRGEKGNMHASFEL